MKGHKCSSAIDVGMSFITGVVYIELIKYENDYLKLLRVVDGKSHEGKERI